MIQFIIDGNFILMNGYKIFESIFANAIAVAPDLKTIYVSSSKLKYVRKYIFNESLLEWILDSSFNDPTKNLTAQYPSGLLLYENDLFISLSNSNNISSILKVNASKGARYFSRNTLLDISTFYTSSNSVLSSMVTNGTYLYAANTGQFNSGKTIVKINLSTGENKDLFIDEPRIAPIQMRIYEKYLCVLLSNLNSLTMKTVVLINLDNDLITHKFDLPNSDKWYLGLSLDNSMLNVIDVTGGIYYYIDLSAENPVVVETPTEG